MLDKIIEIIAKQLGIGEETINDKTNIMDDLGADSLDIVEMLMAIEENFGVTVPDDVIPGLKTVGDILEYVEKNM
jgi:acyl carrier protein